MRNELGLANVGILSVKILAAGLISVMILFGSPWAPVDGHSASAQLFEWNAEDQKDGVYGFLRQLPAYQEKDGRAFTFYARKTIWIFGEGEAMLLEWLPQDGGAQKFKIRFSYLDEDEVSALTSMGSKAERDDFINVRTEGALTQTTSVVFDGQAGLYDQAFKKNRWLPEILLDPSLVDEFQALLDAKYPTEGDDLPASVDIVLNQETKDAALLLKFDLALDAQIYEAAGPSGDDTRLAVYLPGYTPGVPGWNDNIKEGWNNSISMGKDPELFMNAQGLTYQDLANGNRGWGVIIGWNTHLDYDGKQTESKGVEPLDENVTYRGMLTPVGQIGDGLVKRVMALLNTSWAGVPLNGERNIVSHSTGYYLAMDLLNYMPEMWPTASKNRYFAISPNIRGSTMIGGFGGSQAYDSMDDMYRDNWHFDDGYRLNETTRGILKYRKLDDVESHVMLAYGDMMSAGVGGVFSTFAFDQGVVDYTNYQKPIHLDVLDKAEYGRRKRFSLYESLYNMRFDGETPLKKTESKAEWENGGDNYLRNFPENTVISVFGENVNLENQERDDSEDYDEDHSDLAIRMKIMKLIVGGDNIDYVPASGNPEEVVPSKEKPGIVEFSWSASESQSTSEVPGWIGGQLYEIVRKIEGNKALKGWTDKWWQRVALERAEGSDFRVEYRTYETIRNVDVSGEEAHGLWEFSSHINTEVINVPTWLDRSFNGKDLWVRVLNGPLAGGFFKVTEVQDYIGGGYADAGSLGLPESFPDKDEITMTVDHNPAFPGELPDADEETGPFSKVNYLTLGGIKYQYNAAFYGPHDLANTLVIFSEYTEISKIFHWMSQDEEDQKGTGHFMSVIMAEPKTYETDTISPTISFGDPR